MVRYTAGRQEKNSHVPRKGSVGFGSFENHDNDTTTIYVRQTTAAVQRFGRSLKLMAEELKREKPCRLAARWMLLCIWPAVELVYMP